MDFAFTKEEEAFRQQIRDFAKKELPPDWLGTEEYDTDEEWEFTKKMAKKLAAKGWLTLSWPKEYGGGGVTPTTELIYREEIAYHQVPGASMGVGGVDWVGPALMRFGTEEQKKQHLPPIGSGDRFWCTAYSEPAAGSDLASLRLRAVAEGDDWVLNGQKVWTSSGHRAHWCWLAARTDPDAPKHRGISMFVVDMKAPGITVRPLINIANRHSFNEVFFDEVRIPKGNLVGELNRGWYHLATALDFERAGPTTRNGAFCRRMLDELVKYANQHDRDGRSLAKDPIIRQRLADLAVEVEALRMFSYRITWILTKGLVPNYEASMGKVFSNDVMERLVQLGMDMLGHYGILDEGSKWARLGGWIARHCMLIPGSKVAAGTMEIQKNIIAQRGLGLPRGQ